MPRRASKKEKVKAKDSEAVKKGVETAQKDVTSSGKRSQKKAAKKASKPETPGTTKKEERPEASGEKKGKRTRVSSTAEKLPRKKPRQQSPVPLPSVSHSSKPLAKKEKGDVAPGKPQSSPKKSSEKEKLKGDVVAKKARTSAKKIPQGKKGKDGGKKVKTEISNRPVKTGSKKSKKNRRVTFCLELTDDAGATWMMEPEGEGTEMEERLEPYRTDASNMFTEEAAEHGGDEAVARPAAEDQGADGGASSAAQQLREDEAVARLAAEQQGGDGGASSAAQQLREDEAVARLAAEQQGGDGGASSAAQQLREDEAVARSTAEQHGAAGTSLGADDAPQTTGPPSTTALTPSGALPTPTCMSVEFDEPAAEYEVSTQYPEEALECYEEVLEASDCESDAASAATMSPPCTTRGGAAHSVEHAAPAPYELPSDASGGPSAEAASPGLDMPDLEMDTSRDQPSPTNCATAFLSELQKVPLTKINSTSLNYGEELPVLPVYFGDFSVPDIVMSYDPQSVSLDEETERQLAPMLEGPMPPIQYEVQYQEGQDEPMPLAADGAEQGPEVPRSVRPERQGEPDAGPFHRRRQ